MSDSANVQVNFGALAPLYSATFLSGGWAMIIPTIPVLSKEFGVSGGGAAQVITAFAAGKMLGTVIGGVVYDRQGTRIGLVHTPAIAALAALGAVAAPWFWLLLLMALVLGAADTLGAVAREMAAIDQTKASQRGRLISSLHGTHTIAMALCPFLGGWLTELFDYRAAFFGYAVISALAVVLGYWIPASAPEVEPGKAAKRAGKKTSMASLREGLRGLSAVYREIRPDLRATYLSLVFATMVNQSQRIVVQSMLPLYATFFLNLSPSQVGMLFTVSGIVVFSMMIPAGYLMDRVGRKWCTVPSTGVPALVFLLIPMTTSFYQLAILIGCAGIAQGLSLGSLATSTYDVAPPHVRGRLQAMRRVTAELGSGAAPMIGGFLANAFNPAVPFYAYVPLLLISAVLLALVGKETLEK
ncbi:MAG: MFS transporter [Deltaproteobacteria bacterium]|nr:MFS transporter [Deltaproteobacteria bacterium]